MALRHLLVLPLAVRVLTARREGKRSERKAQAGDAGNNKSKSIASGRRRKRAVSKLEQALYKPQSTKDEKLAPSLSAAAGAHDTRTTRPPKSRLPRLSRPRRLRSTMSSPRSFSLRSGSGGSSSASASFRAGGPGGGPEAPSAAAVARAEAVQREQARRAAYEAACLALFKERMPYELQMHVLSFLPVRALVKGLARADRFYSDMVDRYVRGCVWREMRGGAGGKEEEEGRGNRLIFEAQRPIDTLTTKHALYFSHFAPEPPCAAALAAGKADAGGLSTLAHFSFRPPPRASARSASRVGSKSSSRAGSRATSRVREQVQQEAGSTPTGRYAPHGATYTAAEQREDVDVPYNLPASLRSRLNNARLSSSVAPVSVPQTFASSSATQQEVGPARALPSTSETQQVPPPPLPQQQQQQQRAARREHGDLRDFTDVSAPNLWREGSRAEARLVRDDEPDALAATGQVAAADEEQSDADDEDDPADEPTTWSSLGSALDAYDWAGPISSSSASRPRQALSSASLHSPTYAFQLDALDSFESWCLSLTLQHRERPAPASAAASGMMRDTARQVRYGTQWPAPMRWEKRVAEGLDRVFRDFFVPPRPASGHAAAASGSSTPSAAPPQQQPPERVLEFDGPSCVLSIQPHAHAHASFSHPALGGYSSTSASHAYLSFPSLSDQYSAGQARRVELTFHVPAVRISAARLAAALEDVWNDVQRAKEAPRVLEWSTWNSGAGGNWRPVS